MFSKIKTPKSIKQDFVISKSRKTVIHYMPLNLTSKSEILSDLKISQELSLSNIPERNYLMHLRENSKWTKPITRLNPIGEGLFFGSCIIRNKQSLLIFEFNPILEGITVKIFPEYYPEENKMLLQLLASN